MTPPTCARSTTRWVERLARLVVLAWVWLSVPLRELLVLEDRLLLWLPDREELPLWLRLVLWVELRLVEELWLPLRDVLPERLVEDEFEPETDVELVPLRVDFLRTQLAMA
jgi:hypothetical protein